MANMRDIRRRIKSVASTQKITKAMKMVSAAKLRKTQSTLVAIRPYSDKIQEVMDHLLAGGEEYDTPFLKPRDEVKNILYIVIAGDRGLCGGYNINLLRFAEERLKAVPEGQNGEMLLIGNKTSEHFRTRPQYNVMDVFTNIGDAPNVSQGKALSDYVIKKYLDGEVDEVHVIYSRFVSVLTQVPDCQQVLPIQRAAQADAEAEQGMQTETDYIFEPGGKEILDVILPKYVDSSIYRLLLEAKAGEHGARMTAMDSATDNASELIDKLTLSLNRARQAQITTEITEIVGGAAALE
ncbi:MAG TPA: F0F1 ATP synthase subunit gamma [Porphyromonadaceae bacterium]|nr:F0F1 ATP synthase subunit gamma [Porphyromonadaceae bacterium]